MESIYQLRKKFTHHPEKMVDFYQTLFLKIKSYHHLNFYTELYEADVLRKVKDKNFCKNFVNQPLFGVPFFLKDNFLVKNKRVSGGSKILTSFIASFDATVCSKLKTAGAILLGKTTMDELGLGGTGLEAFEGKVVNALDKKRIVGGSSSGSALAMQLKLCAFALGSDTGDSVRAPASYLGVIGYKPSFGLISRYGMIQYSPSLDSVGYFAHSIEDLKIITQVLFAFDDKDFISQLPPPLVSKKNLDLETIKVAVLNCPPAYADQNSIKLLKEKVIAKLKVNKVNFSYHDFDPLLLDNLNFIYQIISFSEALSSQAHLTGINYGKSYQNNHSHLSYQELIKINRGRSFQAEIKRRYLLGAFFLDQENQKKFYLRALKARTYLNHYFEQLLKKYDFILNLATYSIAPLVREIESWKKERNLQKNIIDLFLVGNLLGLPSLVLPFARVAPTNFPLGVNLYTKSKGDWELLAFADWLAKMIKF